MSRGMSTNGGDILILRNKDISSTFIGGKHTHDYAFGHGT